MRGGLGVAAGRAALERGLGTRQIADRLCVSIKTIESHREHIKQKLHLSGAPELVQHATQWVMRESTRL